MPSTELPLAEFSQQPHPDDERAAEIGRLVDRFYELAREDDVLGPIFARAVNDWDAHLATLRAFWMSAIYQTGTYAGRPIQAHQQAGGIRPEHFERWLALWERTVAEVVSSEAGPVLLERARRMAVIMMPRTEPPTQSPQN